MSYHCLRAAAQLQDPPIKLIAFPGKFFKTCPCPVKFGRKSQQDHEFSENKPHQFDPPPFKPLIPVLGNWGHLVTCRYKPVILLVSDQLMKIESRDATLEGGPSLHLCGAHIPVTRLGSLCQTQFVCPFNLTVDSKNSLALWTVWHKCLCTFQLRKWASMECPLQLSFSPAPEKNACGNQSKYVKKNSKLPWRKN